MDTPLVTILIPIYNRLDLLHLTLTSVVNQSYQNWIAYLCDDGSTENVQAAIDKHSDPRLIRKQLSHEGIGSTRNRGIALVETPYFVMLDSDDVWDSHFLKYTVLFLESYPSVGAVQSAQEVINRDGKLVKRRTATIPSNVHGGEFKNIAVTLTDGLKYFLTEPYGFNNLSSLVIRSSHGKAVKAEEIPFMEDWDYLIKLGQRGLTVAYLDRVLCYYRIYDKSIEPEKQIASLLKTITMLKKHRFDQPWQRAIKNRIIGNLLEFIGFNYLFIHKRRQAAIAFRSSLSHQFTFRRIYGLCRCVVPGLVRLKGWLQATHMYKKDEVSDHGMDELCFRREQE